MAYQWLQFDAARQQLADRLYDSANAFWTDVECGLYIIEALRTFNALTWTWKADFVFNPTQVWNSLASMTGSPRLRTVTNQDIYTMMQYHLLEPPTGLVWGGTPQFSTADFASALQGRRDEIIQMSNCNSGLLPQIAAVPNQHRNLLPDTVIDVLRMRFIPSPLAPNTPAPSPVTLYRDDTLAMEYFNPAFYQAASDLPQTYMLSTEPPLSFDVDLPPNYEGYFECLALQSGAPFPSVGLLQPVPLGIPDDFSFVAKWGALADLLGRESEATDRQRAAFCIKRYNDGLQLLLKAPWILLGKVNDEVADLPSFVDQDRYFPEWDSSSRFGASVVLAGIDTIGCPITKGIGVTVVGNAPIPVADTDFVDVSRSNWEAVLDYAQFLATFKLGGSEFEASLPLEARFIQACTGENQRLLKLGLYSDVLVARSGAEDRRQERY